MPYTYLADPQFWKAFVTADHYSYDQIPNLTGKYALVTGANQGIGYATTLGLVAHGAHVVMACRSEAKANEAIERLHRDVTETYPHSIAAAQIAKGDRLKLEFLELDLNDLKKVQKSAQEFLSRRLPLHILVNNSGVGGAAWGLSVDGIENHFAINHLGHFVLTTALLDCLKESQPSRVVVVSALLYDLLPEGGFDLDNINNDKIGDPLQRYGRSKLANILFANALARRLANEQVYVNSLHPGVVDTGMTHHFNDHRANMMASIMTQFAKFTSVTPAQGALTQLYLATSPEVANKDIRGRFFIPVAKELGLNSEALDVDLQEKLWEYSEKIVKEKTQQ
ncbi:Retinol dehydrogenase 14 [Podila verticillata]|nr:Retinol dehydrogenase 14 [Podila verticillata]KFH72019.1 hypothetical protein MVEG_02312 [Podila verticillata NRRL 6337]